MKEIPIDEMAAISREIHEAAVRVGCTEVRITGKIWPGGRVGGPPETAARFVEYSWLKAAVIDGRAIFEEANPPRYAALLNAYGIGDDPIVANEGESPAEHLPNEAEATLPAPETVEMTVTVRTETQQIWQREAEARGLSPGEYLDWRLGPSEL